MATIKACLALVNDFTESDFAELDQRARDYAGDKPLTNRHYINAAKDVIATLEADAETIEAALPKEEPAAAPPKEPVAQEATPPKEAEKANEDLQANAKESVSPAEQRKKFKERIARLSERYEGSISPDEIKAIEKAVKDGDFDLADTLILEVVRDQVQRTRYRTQAGDPPSKTVSRATLEKLVARANRVLKGDTQITILESITELDATQKPGSRAGGLIGGKLYLFRDGIPDGVEGEKTILHELFHKGLRNLLPEAEYRKLMLRMYNQSLDLKRLANQWIVNNPKDALKEGDRYKTDAEKTDAVAALAVEEVLAAKAESLDTLRPGTMRQLGNWAADIAQFFGLDKLAQRLRTMGRTELEKFLQEALRASIKGSTGTDTRAGPDIRYRTVKQALQDSASNLSVDALGKAKQGVLSMSFLRDLGSRFGEKLAGVKDYVDLTFKQSAEAAKIQERATEVRDAISGLKKDERKQLMEFMADVTSSGMVMEPTADRKNGHVVTDEQKAVLAGLQTRFNRLSAAQKKAYRKARDELAANWKKRGDLLARSANEIYRPLIEEAKITGNETQVKELERQLRAYMTDLNARLSQVTGDYFPMMRFGDFVVVRKSDTFETLQKQVDDAYDALEALHKKYDRHTPEQLKAIRAANKKLEAMGATPIGDYTEQEAAEIKAARDNFNDLSAKLERMKASEKDYYVAEFESESEAKNHAKEIGGTVSLKRENARELNPITRTLLSRLEESMAATLRARGSATALIDAKRAMYEVYLQTLPERSALLRTAKRKNVAGFDRDMERAIVSAMLRDSFYLSRMEYGDRISEALNTSYKDAKDKKDVDLQRVSNELARRHAASMRYVDTPVQDALAGLTYIYKLGVSPGYLIANMMQPFTVSVPMLMARHGGASIGAFGKAWGETVKAVNASLKASLGKGEVDFRNAGLKPDEVAMLEEMLQQRLLNVTLVADLARTADGQPTSKFASLMAKPSHFVEVMNRMSTALAAYRLEKAKSGQDAAVKYAQRVLADSHFDYSVENAPYWMKPGTLPLNKLLFQFKKYQLGMVSMFVKAGAAMATGTKQQKREAMAQVLGVATTHFAVGGLLGLPGIGLFNALANMIARAFGDDDEPWDAEVALRNYLADNFGKEAGAALSKGLPTVLGMDLSQKVGLGDILNPVPTLRSDKQGRDFALEILASGMGPFFGGIIPDMFDAASMFAKGDFVKGTEKVLPKWIADPIKAGRFAEEGITTRQGTVALDRENISAWDVALQAAGLPAVRITESYEARAAVEAVKSTLGTKASEYKKDWLDARRSGDMEKAEEIWQEIKTKTNPARVRNGLEPITKSDLFRFERQRGKDEAKYSQFGANTNAKMAETGRFALQ